MTATHADREAHQHRIVELEDFDQLADPWDRLARKSGSPIEQYIWAKACADALSDRYRPYVLVVGPGPPSDDAAMLVILRPSTGLPLTPSGSPARAEAAAAGE